MKVNNVSNTCTFSSRCPQIKLAQDVCNKVNNEFPHSSLSKLQPYVTKNNLNKYPHQISPVDLMLIIQEFIYLRPRNTSHNISSLKDIIDFAKEYKSFNCYESSFLSEFILKLNGIKNARTVELGKGDYAIDHSVCLFNRDGSKFDGRIKNNETIFVDAWAGFADFANNALKKYDYIFNPSKEGRYVLTDVMNLKMTDYDINKLRKEFPNLVIRGN